MEKDVIREITMGDQERIERGRILQRERNIRA
jgi:hypothetical protein